jgi:hypothetical protein
MIDFNAEWRAIPGWPEYSVSEDGNVCRVMRGPGARPGHVLKPWLNRQTQYLFVGLWRDNRGRGIPVHRLVALAFLGQPPSEDHVVAHCDGSRDNNQPWNLRWATQKENVADTVLHGTHNRGARNGQAKLDDNAVLRILGMAVQGIPRRELAQAFGVRRQAIDDIINGRRWKHVTKSNEPPLALPAKEGVA